ncbi:MAG: SRPBCC family protein [Vicingaceae bacterium]
MKVLKWILIVIAALIAVFLIYSATQPNQLVLEESISIDAPKEQIFSEVTNFRNWGEWSEWDRLDPDMEQKYSEKMGEVGSFNSWKSNNPMVGNGSQEVVEVRPNEYMKVVMKFGERPDKNYTEFILSEEDGKTKVVWTMEGAKTPFYLNVMNTFMEPMIRDSYKKSLKRLKSYIEEMPTEVPNPMGLEVMEVEGVPIVSILDSTTGNGISSKLGELYQEISMHIATSGAKQAGMPLAIYHTYSPEKVILEAAIPYSGNVESKGRVQVKETPSGKVIKGIHYGDYAASEAMHYSISDYAQAKSLKISDTPWEIYANDPSEVDSAAVETHIYYQIQ